MNAEPTPALGDLIALLTTEDLGDGVHRGPGSVDDGWDAVYGGHFVGQATAAVQATVDADRRIHSLHGYFLKSGAPSRPIDYQVVAVRDGGTFSTRRVSATQIGDDGSRGPVLFEATASFCRDEDGAVIDAQPPDGFDALPDPESLPTYRDVMLSHDEPPLPAEWALRDQGVDVRPVYAPWVDAGPSPNGGICHWMRAAGPMPEDSRLHNALLAYQSDETVSDNVLVPFGVTWGTPDTMIVSLDHAIWFHRPMRMDEWHYVEQRPLVAGRGRGVAAGYVWTTTGELACSFTQEALMRF